MSPAASSRCSPSPTRARCCSRRHAHARKQVRTMPIALLPRAVRRGCGAAGLFRHRADLSPADHLAVQAAVQRYVDSVDLQDHQRAGGHLLRGVSRMSICEAYRAGLQGLHHLSAQRRDGRRCCRGVDAGPRRCLAGARRAPTAVAARRRAGPRLMANRRRRRRLYDPAAGPAGELLGHTYKMKWPDSDHALYITINDIEQDGGGGRSRSSSTPRTWSITPGRWR